MPHVTVPASCYPAEHRHDDLVARVRAIVRRELEHGVLRLHGQHGDTLAIEHGHSSVSGPAGRVDVVDATPSTVSGSVG